MATDSNRSYAAAGVDITAGYRAVDLMRSHIARTMPDGAPSIGGFGGLFPLPAGYREPVLVAGTDGVGTKLRIAQLLDRHSTVGIDCVAMCVNDVLCCGARPLFFLDYIACGKNIPEKVATLVGGVAEGCVRAGCALIGGETAEHPGVMREDDYDIAGFAVGIVEREKILAKTASPGDVILALPSSGLHSNGYSLVRAVFDVEHADLTSPREGLDGAPLGEVLLTPTKIYVKPILALLARVAVKGISHITGGGFYENIPRSLPSGVAAVIEKRAVRSFPIFSLLQREGNIDEHDMFNTFNMGVGMTVIVAEEDADAALAVLRESGEDAYPIGRVVREEGGQPCRVSLV